MQTFSVHHALICPNEGLVIACHNEICDDIIHLTRQDFKTNCVSGKPIIHLGHRILEEEVRHIGSVTETWGNVSIRGLREIHTEEIIDVRFGYAEADTWKPEGMGKLSACWGKIKKDKHGQACYNQRIFFLHLSSWLMGL